MEFFDDALQRYLDHHTDPETEVLARLNRETNLKVMYPRMLSGHYSGRFLAMIAKLLQPNKIVEVGTYTGYSALCLAEGLPEGGELHTIDVNPETMDYARRYVEAAGKSAMIHLHEGDALEILPQLQGAVELAFLDAKKEQYKQYYELLLPKMPAGGVILTDNVLWSGKVVDKSFTDKTTEALREYNDYVAQDERVEKIMLPIRDGIYLARKR